MSRTLRLFAGAAAMLVVAVGVAVVLKDEPGYEAGRLEISGKIEGLTEYQEGRASSGEKSAPHAFAVSDEKPEVRSSVTPERKAELSPSADSEKGKESGQAELPPAAAAPAHAMPPLQPVTVQNSDSFSAVNALDLPDSAEVLPAASSSVKTEEAGNDKAPAAVSAPSAASSEKEAAEPVESRAPEKKEKAAPEEKKPAEEKPSEGAGSASPVKEALKEARSSLENEPAVSAEKPAQRYERVVTSAKFSMKGSLIKLVLQGNAPMVGHYSILGNPDRVVLDLAGNWEINVPRVPSNRLIQAVRVGQHEDKTRIVFDMKTMGKVALVPVNRNSLELSIQ